MILLYSAGICSACTENYLLQTPTFNSISPDTALDEVRNLSEHGHGTDRRYFSSQS